VNEGFKGRSYCKNILSELKAVLKMTNARPDTSGKTAMHSCSNDGITQLHPLGSNSDAMFEIVEICDACFINLLFAVCCTCCIFKSGEFGGHCSGEMNSGVSLSRNSTVVQAF